MIARILSFLKSPAGAALLFLLAMFTFFHFVREYRERKANSNEGEGANVLGRMSPEEIAADPDESVTSEWVKEGSLEKFNPPKEAMPPAPPAAEPRKASLPLVD